MRSSRSSRERNASDEDLHKAPSREQIAKGEFIPVTKAAKRLGVDPKTVYRGMDKGEIPYVRPNGIDSPGRRVSLVWLEWHIRRSIVGA